MAYHLEAHGTALIGVSSYRGDFMNTKRPVLMPARGLRSASGGDHFVVIGSDSSPNKGRANLSPNENLADGTFAWFSRVFLTPAGRWSAPARRNSGFAGGGLERDFEAFRRKRRGDLADLPY